jgi:hypothetical protein
MALEDGKTTLITCQIPIDILSHKEFSVRFKRVYTFGCIHLFLFNSINFTNILIVFAKIICVFTIKI